VQVTNISILMRDPITCSDSAPSQNSWGCRFGWIGRFDRQTGINFGSVAGMLVSTFARMRKICVDSTHEEVGNRWLIMAKIPLNNLLVHR
jgi:hypothetical protein